MHKYSDRISPPPHLAAILSYDYILKQPTASTLEAINKRIQDLYISENKNKCYAISLRRNPHVKASAPKCVY